MRLIIRCNAEFFDAVILHVVGFAMGIIAGTQV